MLDRQNGTAERDMGLKLRIYYETIEAHCHRFYPAYMTSASKDIQYTSTSRELKKLAQTRLLRLCSVH